MNLIFLGTIQKGKLILNNQDGFDKYLLTLENKGIKVILRRIKKDRSNKENRYYWGVVVKLLSNHTGYSSDEMHDALRMLFLRDTDRKILTIRSTTSLTTVEFEFYLTQIREWASMELDCYIPLPKEVEV